MDTSIQLTYLLSAILFVVGLKRLQSPATARKGNGLAALAMLLAVIATVLDTQILDWTWILVGVVLGGVIGGTAARLVEMTAMPELVGIFNAFGGGASALVAIVEFLATPGIGASTTGVTILLGTLIGSVTFSGSFIAFAKLQGLMTGNPITFPFQNAFNALLFLAAISLGAMTLGVFGSGDPQTLFYVLSLIHI